MLTAHVLTTVWHRCFAHSDYTSSSHHQITTDNLQDILATDTAESLSDVEIDNAGCVSDHQLVHANLAFSVPTTCVITWTFQKVIVPASFETVLRHSVLSASPATTVDALTDQMVNVITDELDKVAPLKRCTSRPSKPIMKWLTNEAIAAKRERRSLRGSGSPHGVSVTVSTTVVLVVAQTDSSTSHGVCTSTDGSVTAPTRDNNEESERNSFTPLIVT